MMMAVVSQVLQGLQTSGGTKTKQALEEEENAKLLYQPADPDKPHTPNCAP